MVRLYLWTSLHMAILYFMHVRTNYFSLFPRSPLCVNNVKHVELHILLYVKKKNTLLGKTTLKIKNKLISLYIGVIKIKYMSRNFFPIFVYFSYFLICLNVSPFCPCYNMLYNLCFFYHLNNH